MVVKMAQFNPYNQQANQPPTQPAPKAPELFPGYQNLLQTTSNTAVAASSQYSKLSNQRNQLLSKLAATPTQDEKVLKRLLFSPESQISMLVTGDANQEAVLEQQRKA